MSVAAEGHTGVVTGLVPARRKVWCSRLNRGNARYAQRKACNLIQLIASGHLHFKILQKCRHRQEVIGFWIKPVNNERERERALTENTI